MVTIAVVSMIYLLVCHLLGTFPGFQLQYILRLTMLEGGKAKETGHDIGKVRLFIPTKAESFRTSPSESFQNIRLPHGDTSNPVSTNPILRLFASPSLASMSTARPKHETGIYTYVH